MFQNLLTTWWFWAIPLAFIAIVIYAFNPKRKKEFQDEARIPLEDDPPDKRR